MPRDINRRLGALKSRRTGIDKLSRVSTNDAAILMARSAIEESYQKRAPTRAYTRYALGAMQEVGAEYTRISVETATRIQGQLETALGPLGRSVGFRLQGSVPCNIHIRGVSDVDLLTLDTAFFSYDGAGLAAQNGNYRSPISYTPLSALQTLRSQIEKILKDKYPAADVDITGSKAVKISGGSLARPVDVVPSHWYNTVDYQSTWEENDRGVCILDRKNNTTLLNMPFRHIKRITDRDVLSYQGLKKSIRLCKNVKSDAKDDGISIDLPSFDIAATMYHADIPSLRRGSNFELTILAETQRHLDFLACNFDHARTLIVPDGSRRIFDSETKLNGLRLLSIEMDDLLKEVAKENKSLSSLGISQELSLMESRALVDNIYVPAI